MIWWLLSVIWGGLTVATLSIGGSFVEITLCCIMSHLCIILGKMSDREE